MRILPTICLLLQASLAFCLSSGQITLSNGTGPYFYADDGNCGSSEVPQAAYLVVNVENTSSSDTLFNVKVKLTSISNTADGFKMLSFQDDSTYTIPRILPDSSVGAYFYIQYPCNKNKSCTFGFTLSDADAGTVSYNTAMSTQDIGPAGAGGDIVSQSIAGIDALGILVADTVTYEFGNYNGGEMFFQPSGDTLFPTNDLELIGSEIISSAFGSCGPKAGDRNTLYYNAGSGCGAGSGNLVKVVYYYLSSLFNDTAAFKPYAGMKSGGPIKYLSNYGSGVAMDSFGTTLNANKFTMTKSASCGICTPGDTITYTITIANGSSEDLMFDRIYDSLPAGHSYVGFEGSSDIDKSNCSVYPTSGATGNVLFAGLIPGATFPYRSFTVPGGGSISLKYRVKIPGSSSSTVFTNQAIGEVGSVKLDTVTAQTCAGCPSLPVAMLYFNGKRIANSVELTWSTAFEQNNAGFELSRGQEFIAFVPGMGNSTEINEYTFRDELVLATKQIYVLHQIDFDGTSTPYYTSVGSSENEKVNAFKIVPHPVVDMVRLELPSESEQTNVKLVSTLGQVVWEHTDNNQSRHLEFDWSSITSGIYTLRIEREALIPIIRTVIVQ